MKKFMLFLTIFIFTLCLFPTTKSGIYISFSNNVNTLKFEDNIQSSQDTLLSGYLGLTLSIYNDNLFEVNLHLNMETETDYQIPEKDTKRYGLGLEVGKLFSIAINKNNKTIISPDLCGGAFVKIGPIQKVSGIEDPVTPDLFLSYGAYVSIKLKINALAESLKLRSIDVGWKAYFPFHSNYPYEGFTIVHHTFLIFAGVSF